MPSTSKKQHNLMAAVANNPAFAKKAGIPQRVGADFLKADKGRKFAKGGDMAKKFPPFMGKESKAEEAKEMKVKAKSFALYKKGEKAEGVHGKSGKEKPTKYAKGGGCELKGKTKAQRFAGGGSSMGAPEPLKYSGPVPTGTPQMGLKPKDPKNMLAPKGVAPAPTMYEKSMSGGSGNMGSGNILLPGDMRYRGDDPALTKKFREQQLPDKMRMAEAAARGAQQKFLNAKNPAPDARFAGLTSKPKGFAPAMQKPSASPRPVMPPSRDDTNGFIENERRLNDMYRPAVMKKGGAIKKFAKGGAIDGCATKGKTKGRII